MYATLIVANTIIYTPKYFAHEGLKTAYIDNDFCDEIKQIADDNDISTFVFVNMVEQAEIMTLYDSKRNYVGYYTKDRSVRNYDNYLLNTDSSILTDKNIIAVSENGYEKLEDYIKNNYSQIGYIGEFFIMISDYCPMDVGTFIIQDTTTIDLPISPGYQYTGDIGAKGYLFTSQEGNVLESNDIPAAIPFTYILNYDIENTSDADVITLNIYQNDKLFNSIILDNNGHKLSTDLEGNAT